MQLGIHYNDYYAIIDGEPVTLNDIRELQEPTLHDGMQVTIYGYGGGLSTINIKESRYQSLGIFGGFNYNSTVSSYEIPNIDVCKVELN